MSIYTLSLIFSPASRTLTRKHAAHVTCVDTAVPLQLAGLGERLFTGVTFKHSGLLRAQRRAGLMSLHVLLLHTQKGRKTEIVAGLTDLQQETRPRDHMSSKDDPSPIRDERPRGFSGVGGWPPDTPGYQLCRCAGPLPSLGTTDLDGF